MRSKQVTVNLLNPKTKRVMISLIPYRATGLLRVLRLRKYHPLLYPPLCSAEGAWLTREEGLISTVLFVSMEGTKVTHLEHQDTGLQYLREALSHARPTETAWSDQGHISHDSYTHAHMHEYNL